MIQEPLTHEQTVYRCHGCKAALIALDMTLGVCATCGNNKYSPATHVSDEEMKALLGRGFKFFEEDWTHVTEEQMRDRRLPPLETLLRQVA